MLFNSIYYYVFLLVVFVIYYLVNNKAKWFVLFAASIFFIGTIAPNLVLFTLLFTIINYFIGIAIQEIKMKSYRKFIFWFGIFTDIGVLAFYKYINFLFENINFLIGYLPSEPSLPYLSIVIPVGISYYTFQALGYLIRINRGSEKAERNFIIFATFLTFFPKFLSGPVERSNHFFPQLKSGIEFKRHNISAGLRLFLWGLFKKVVIGNNLAAPVFMVYNDVHHYTGIPLITVLIVQAFHIYCDFSGYTDMALGTAKLFGINLIDNFNRPFFAKNVGEFWRRWHISLSSWCNDFIFSPFIVKFRKFGNNINYIGIFLSFFVIGIWHGANWTFVVLGLLQGIAISYEFFTKRKRIQLAGRLPKFAVIFLSRLITFLFFCFSLVFFNSSSLHDSWYFITHLFTDLKIQFEGYDFIYEKNKFLIAMGLFILVLIIEYFNEKGTHLIEYFMSMPRMVRWAGYYLILIIIFYFSGTEKTFVYLQF